jgi:hypothetical protein
LIVVVLVSLCPTASFAQDFDFRVKQAQGQIKVHRENAGTEGTDKWFEAKSTEGHFRVRVPEKFIDFTESKSSGMSSARQTPSHCSAK